MSGEQLPGNAEQGKVLECAVAESPLDCSWRSVGLADSTSSAGQTAAAPEDVGGVWTCRAGSKYNGSL